MIEAKTLGVIMCMLEIIAILMLHSAVIDLTLLDLL